MNVHLSAVTGAGRHGNRANPEECPHAGPGHVRNAVRGAYARSVHAYAPGREASAGQALCAAISCWYQR
ncbi:hypothetical protein RKD45_005442 [Streptomyces griseus]